MLGRQRAICVNEKYMDGHTLGQTVSDIRQQLSGKYSEREANAFIRIIFRNLMHYEPVDILLRKDSILPDFICNKTWQVVGELLKNRPIQYIFGQTYFCGHIFNVNESTLIPQPDTEILVETALELIKDKKNPKVLDICTGSGAIITAIKHNRPDCDACFSDISIEALKVASYNYENIIKEKGNAKVSDLFEEWRGYKFDLITANAPYIAKKWFSSLSKEVLSEPHLALLGPDEDGLGLIRRIIDDAHSYLEEGATLLLESDYRQTEEIRALLKRSGYSEINTKKDLSGLERVSYGRFFLA